MWQGKTTPEVCISSGHRDQPVIPGLSKSWYPTEPSSNGICFPARAYVYFSLFHHLLATYQNICLIAKLRLTSRDIQLVPPSQRSPCIPTVLIAQAMIEKEAKERRGKDREAKGAERLLSLRTASRELPSSRHRGREGGGRQEGYV